MLRVKPIERTDRFAVEDESLRIGEIWPVPPSPYVGSQWSGVAFRKVSYGFRAVSVGVWQSSDEAVQAVEHLASKS